METSAFGLTVGNRIVLKHMGSDPAPMEPGATGTVTGFCTVKGLEQIQMDWDGGRGLNLIPSVDGWQRI
jgi:hypothetical protein